MLGRQQGSRRPASLKSKPPKRVQDDCPTQEDECGSDKPQEVQAQQCWLKSPMVKPEGNNSSNKSGGEKKKCNGPEDGRARPHVRRQFTLASRAGGIQFGTWNRKKLARLGCGNASRMPG